MTNNNYILVKSLNFKPSKRILNFQIKVLDGLSVHVLQEADAKTVFNVQEIFREETPMRENEEEARGG